MSTFYIATAGVEAAPLQDGSVLYNLNTSKFVLLNRPLALIWSELATPKTSGDVVARLCASIAGPAPSTARHDVEQALAQLVELQLASQREDAGDSADAARVAPVDGQGSKPDPFAYECPSARVLNEEELLNIFQMTAAEISVASCWWGGCPSGCP
jgi:hypothetical protein